MTGISELYTRRVEEQEEDTFRSFYLPKLFRFCTRLLDNDVNVYPGF